MQHPVHAVSSVRGGIKLLPVRLAELDAVFRTALPAALWSTGCCANWRSDLTAYSRGCPREKMAYSFLALGLELKREGGNIFFEK